MSPDVRPLSGARGPKVLVVAGLGDSLLNFRRPLLEHLVKRGCEVSTAAARHDAQDGLLGVDVVGGLAAIGVEHQPIPMCRNSTSPWADLQTFVSLVRLCRRNRPGVVLCYTAKAVVYGTLAAWVCRVPRRVVMLTGLPFGLAESTGPRGLSFRVARTLFRATFRMAHSAIFHNADDRGVLVASGALPVGVGTHVVNGSGVDLARFVPAPLPEGPDLVFLMIARLLPEKGVFEFLGAARAVKEVHPSARFLLVGPLDGHGAREMASHVRAWEQEGSGEWLGPMPDVREALRRCSVYVLPSHHEGTPRTVLEAMATGRPIVTTDAPGCRETVREGENGYLVAPGSVPSLVEGLLRCFGDPEALERMGRASRRFVEERYEAGRVAEDTAVCVLGADE